MRATSLHRRTIDAPVEVVGGLIDTLASPDDRLWPHEHWPAMRFDRPLGVGAAGGHAFIRYRVVDHIPARSITFRFTAPAGLTGTHSFEVRPDEDGPVLVHTIDARARGWFSLAWPLVVRPLHEALMTDAMAKAESEATGCDAGRPQWSGWVRLLRRALRRRR
jgi:hypothetical protein